MKKENYKQSEKTRISHKEKIFELFKDYPNKKFTNHDIRIIHDFNENIQVARRTCELYDDGLISIVGYVKIRKMTFALYQLTPKALIESMRLKAYQIKQNDWIEQGIRKGYIHASQFKLKN